MTLIDAVQEIGLDKTDAEIVAALGASVSLPYNTQRWTYAGVAAEFGPEVAEGLSAAMTGAGLTTAVIAYATVGFDLSLDATRAQLDAIAAAVPPLATACNALKAIGRPTGPRWQHAGLPSLPSESDVAAARRQIDVSQWWSTVANEIVSPMLDTATVAELKAAIAGAE